MRAQEVQGIDADSPEHAFLIHLAKTVQYRMSGVLEGVPEGFASFELGAGGSPLTFPRYGWGIPPDPFVRRAIRVGERPCMKSCSSGTTGPPSLPQTSRFLP